MFNLQFYVLCCVRSEKRILFLVFNFINFVFDEKNKKEEKGQKQTKTGEIKITRVFAEERMNFSTFGCRTD